MPLCPPSPNRSNGADYSTIADLQQQMEKLLSEMDRRADSYAKARQCREFIGDRKKAILGRCFVFQQDSDTECSATAAEHRARASATFKSEMQDLIRESGAAETEIVHNEILRTRLEVCRSWLAIERAKMGLV